MTGSLRKELVATPLRVTSICPGMLPPSFKTVAELHKYPIQNEREKVKEKKKKKKKPILRK